MFWLLRLLLRTGRGVLDVAGLWDLAGGLIVAAFSGAFIFLSGLPLGSKILLAAGNVVVTIIAIKALRIAWTRWRYPVELIPGKGFPTGRPYNYEIILNVNCRIAGRFYARGRMLGDIGKKRGLDTHPFKFGWLNSEDEFMSIAADYSEPLQIAGCLTYGEKEQRKWVARVFSLVQGKLVETYESVWGPENDNPVDQLEISIFVKGHEGADRKVHSGIYLLRRNTLSGDVELQLTQPTPQK